MAKKASTIVGTFLNKAPKDEPKPPPIPIKHWKDAPRSELKLTLDPNKRVYQCINLADLNNQFEKAGEQLVVVGFFATWCENCQSMAPKFEEMEGDMSYVMFLKIDAEKAEDVARKYNIISLPLPTFILFRERERIADMIPAIHFLRKQTVAEIMNVNLERLKNIINQHSHYTVPISHSNNESMETVLKPKIYHCTILVDINDQLEKAGDQLVVVEFFDKFCSLCQKMAPRFEVIAQTVRNAVFLKVDVEEVHGAALKYIIMDLPTFILFKNKQKVADVIGNDPRRLKALIMYHAGKLLDSKPRSRPILLDDSQAGCSRPRASTRVALIFSK